MIDLRFKFSPDALMGTIDLLKKSLAAPNAPGLKRGFEDAGTVVLQFWRRRFQRLSKGGGVWRKLKPATIKAKRGNATILVRKGRLFSSLNRGSPDCVFAVDKRGLTIGSMVPYERYHHNGTTHLPMRRVRVKPDARTRELMRQRMTLAVNVAANDAIMRSRGKGGSNRAA